MKNIGILPSKSEAHRMIIAGALCNPPCEIRLEETSDDIEATRSCMQVIHKARETGNPAELHCRESGSTFRFLIPLVAALGIPTNFYPEGRLPDRPLSPLYEELEAHGVTMTAMGTVPFTVTGNLTPGEYILPGNVSSQYITGLLLALPLLSGDSTIRVTGERQSMGYINMTLRVLSRFGIRVITEQSTSELVYRIFGGQEYTKPTDRSVEGDWSNAAFWLTAGILGEEPVRVTGLNLNSAQGDRSIVNWIHAFGGRIETEGDSVTAYPSRDLLHGTEINAAQIPDMVPALSLIATQAKGVTEINHAERLRLKESDRLESVTNVLKALGAEVRELPDGLQIRGRTKLYGTTVNSYGDHRIAMMAAIASLVADGCVTITDAESVNKSYPTFFTIMDKNEMSSNIERR